MNRRSTIAAREFICGYSFGRRLIVVLWTVCIPLTCFSDDGVFSGSDSAPASQILSSVSAKDLMALLREEGFAVKMDEKDRDIIDMKVNRLRAAVFVWDEGKTIEFYIGFNDQTLPLDQIIEWSSSSRVARISINDKGNARLSLKLHLSGGVTPEWVLNHADAFRDECDEFQKITVDK